MHIGDLHAEIVEPKTEHQITITGLYCSVFLEYLFKPSSERRKQGRKAEVERTARLHVLHWERWTQRHGRLQHTLSYIMAHMDAIHFKTKYFLRLGLTVLGHTLSLSLSF